MARAISSLLLLVLGTASAWSQTTVEPHPGAASPPSDSPPVPVRVWRDTIALPTYEEGPPDINPPFDQFVTNGRYH